MKWELDDHGLTRDGEENDFLIREFFAGVVALRNAAGGDAFVFCGVRDIAKGLSWETLAFASCSEDVGAV